MQTPASNLELMVGFLEKISTIASSIELKFSALITAIKNIKVVNPAAAAGGGTTAAGGGGKKNKKQDDAASNFEQSSSSASDSFSKIETAIVAVSAKIESMGTSIDIVSNSIIEFGSLFSQWEDNLNSFAQEASRGVPQIEGFGNELAKYGKIVDSTGKGIIEYGSLNSQWEDASRDITEFVQVVQGSFSEATSALDSATRSIGDKSGGGGGDREGQADDSIFQSLMMMVVPALKSALGGLVGFIGKVGSGLYSLANTLISLPNMFMRLVKSVSPFVRALDPALMQQLELAFSNLQAVIGVALTPIISAAVTIFSMMADQLKPVMEFLMPSVEKLALAIIDEAVPYVQMMAYALAEMGPVIDNLTAVMQPLAAMILPLVIAGFRGIAAILNMLIGVFNFAIAGVYGLIGAFDKAASWLTSWISKSSAKSFDKSAEEAFANMKKYSDQGSKSFSDAFSDISQKVAPAVKGGGAGMAAKQASYAGISDLGKSMMQAAFGSSKASVANQQLEQQKRAADGIDKLIGLGLRQDVGNRRQAGVRG
jgi:hypothetical protein